MRIEAGHASLVKWVVNDSHLSPTPFTTLLHFTTDPFYNSFYKGVKNSVAALFTNRTDEKDTRCSRHAVNTSM